MIIYILILFIKTVFRLPFILYWFIYDFCTYVKYKKWNDWDAWGIHLFTGDFGGGKTSMMVKMAYRIAARYPQVTILTNFKLVNFPAHTIVKPITTMQDILDSPENTLILIDEIGTIFNSRDFSSGKDAIPKILFRHICQCRHNRKMLFATTQRYNFLDKQLRDIASTITTCSMKFAHPFSRTWFCWKYDVKEYEMALSNPEYPLRPIGLHVMIQNNKDRKRYDTRELIESLYTKEYENPENDSESNVVVIPDNKRKRKKFFQRSKKIR